MQTPQQPRRLLRREEVLARLGYKREALRVAINRGDFPPPVKVFEGGRTLFWDEDEVEAHIARRFAMRKEKSDEVSDDDTTDNSLPHMSENETGNNLPHEHRTNQARARQHRPRTRRRKPQAKAPEH